MALDDELIAGLKQEYKRTNIQELDLASEDNLARRVGMILKQSPDKHQLLNSTGFDPVHIQFLRKMTSAPIFEKRVRVIKKDYFAAVTYLEFFTRFVVEDSSILDNMHRRTRQLEQIDPFLDPNLELAIRCCALEYMANYRSLAHNDRRKNHYNHGNQEIAIEYSNLRRIDPIFEAAGQLFLEQLNNDKIKERLRNVYAINDLTAIAFIDINLFLYKTQVSERAYKRTESEIITAIDNRDYLKAAHLSMDKIARNISRQPLSAYIATMEPTRY